MTQSIHSFTVAIALLLTPAFVHGDTVENGGRRLTAAEGKAANQHAQAATGAMKAKDFQRAIREWTQVIRLAPEFAPAYHHRSTCYDELSMWETAISDADQFIRLQPNDSNAWSQRAIIHADAGEIRAGLADSDYALRLNPKDASALALRGDIHRLDERWEDALKDADAALKLDPKLSRAYQVKGRVYVEQKEYGKAIDAFTKVIELRPSWPNPLVARAGARADAGDYKGALADYRLAISRFPKSERTHDGLAWFLATCPEGEWRDGKQALKEAKTACDLSGWNDPYNVATLAAALAETGDFAGAIQRAEQAVRAKKFSKGDREEIQRELASYRAHKSWRDVPRDN